MNYVWANGEEELFNLAEDPGEKNNLLSTSLEIADRLRARLAAWEEEVKAPRLRDYPDGPR